MVGHTLLVFALTLQGDAGVFPANPLPPLVVSSGGVAAATTRVGSVFLNPATAEGARGLELSFVSYPQTGLRGFSVVAVSSGKLAVVAGLWSYSLDDIFDPEVVAADPTVGTLGVSSAAGSVGAAWRLGPVRVGVLATGRTQSIVGAHTSATSWSAGAWSSVGTVEVGASLVNEPWGNRTSSAAPDRAMLIGVAASRAISSSAIVRIEVDGYAYRAESANRSDIGLSPMVRYGPVEVAVGYTARGGWSGGAGLTQGRWRVDAGTNFVGGDRLDQRVALSVSHR